MPEIIVCRNLSAVRKAFLDSQRHGLPPPKLSELKGKKNKISDKSEELFIDKLAEVLAEEYRKQEGVRKE